MGAVYLIGQNAFFQDIQRGRLIDGRRPLSSLPKGRSVVCAY